MRKFIASARMLLPLLGICLAWGAATAQSGHLDFADKVRLVNCDPSTPKPCFRVKFNVVDAQGAPLNVDLPPNKDLRGKLKVYLDNQEIDPFYAVSQSRDKQTVRGRIALILVDISGSMNHKLPTGLTRFETAKAALTQFLQGFDSSVDRIAIVPFESHDVESRIRSAQFATTSAQALEQIEALPAPGLTNNTALYSAVVDGLQVLADQTATASASSASAPESLLVVMTDGKNEVLKGDDFGLLDGFAGQQQAGNAVRTSGVQVIAVGFGDPQSIDESALRAVSTKSYMADDLEKLTQAFTFARTLLTNRLVATFASPWDDRASLGGKTLQVKGILTLPGGKQFASEERTWAAPQMGIPTFDGKCETAELKAALPVVPASTSLLSTLRPVLVFIGLGTTLLILWFWVPRLVWPEQYIGTFPTRGDSGGMRWASMSRARRAPDEERGRSHQAPPGFQTRKGGGPQAPRAPSDRTVIRPDLDFSKSRLQKRPPGDRDY